MASASRGAMDLRLGWVTALSMRKRPALKAACLGGLANWPGCAYRWRGGLHYHPALS